MDRGTLVSTTNGGNHLIPQPNQVRFQAREDCRRSEVPCKWLVTMQKVPRVSIHYYTDGVEQPAEIAFLDERSTEIRHDEIAREHHFFGGQIDKHRVVRFPATYGDQLDLRPSDFQIRPAVDGDVRLVVAHVVETESLAKKLLGEDSRGVQFAVNFFLIVTASKETRMGIKRAEIRIASHMVPMRVGD